MTTLRLTPGLALLLAAVGCGEPAGPSLGPGEVAPGSPLVVEPTRLDLGRVGADEVERGRIRVTNATQETLTISVFDLPAPLLLETPTPVEIAPSAALALDFALPGAELTGPWVGSATLGCLGRDDCRTPLELSAAPKVDGGWGVAPAALSFPRAFEAETVYASAILTNDGDEPLVATARIEGPDATRFGVRPPRATVPPGGSAELEVGFSPSREGAHEATLVLSDEQGEQIEVPIAGLGQRGRCQWRASPASLDFGAVQAGQPLRRSFELRNVGVAPCQFTVVPDSPAFVEPRAPLEGLAGPEEAFVVPVLLDPSATEEPEARLLVVVNGEQTQLRLSWTEADSALLIVPDEIDFGAVPVGCSRERTVQVYNPGSRDATLTAAMIRQAGFHAVHPTLPASLDSGRDLELSVQLSPAQATVTSAALEILAEFSGAPVEHRIPVRFTPAPAGPCD